MGLCGTKEAQAAAATTTEAPENRPEQHYDQLFPAQEEGKEDNGQQLRRALERIWEEGKLFLCLLCCPLAVAHFCLSADANGDGELSIEENRRIVPKYLRALQEGMMRVFISQFTSEFKKRVDPEESQQMQQTYDIIMREYMPKMKQFIEKELTAVDTDVVSGFGGSKAFKEMDTNANGKVERDEFITKFIGAMNKVIPLLRCRLLSLYSFY
ncbi:unnamed protein product [Symbiodinium sp. KB8]|nr:unnamed protein product [Symbiodinium sp. KB8]